MTGEPQILIIGASSAIAGAMIERYLKADNVEVITCSRGPAIHNGATHIQTEYTETAIVDALKCLELNNLKRVYICNGTLHDEKTRPEKRIEDFNAEDLMKILGVNTLIPMLWLKALTKVVRFNQECVITVFSARVGSINDNGLGGWYSYRASKAALNMLLKTAAIELARRQKKVKLLAFHPGTTDTPLSKPFQANVPEGKLFTPDFVAERLIELTGNLEFDQKLSYLDWQGKPIPW